MKLQFVEHAWTVLWRSFSTRFNALGLLILGWAQVDPIGVLSVWNMMPPPVQAILPHNFVIFIGSVLIALSMLSRVVKQPELRAKVAEKSDAAG